MSSCCCCCCKRGGRRNEEEGMEMQTIRHDVMNIDLSQIGPPVYRGPPTRGVPVELLALGPAPAPPTPSDDGTWFEEIDENQEGELYQNSPSQESAV